ncbi:hypothetical protein LY76DRAFT_644034 [Colletotrichum caudatum]|nr:hypothetical protein LY76DRAFT_644034 [Colletotrichum caudatum]
MAKKKQGKAAECQTSPDDGMTLDIGPEVSPYTSSICEIYFKTQQPFMIHRDLIRASSRLDEVCSDSNEIYINDVPDEAGHVLVNYLYTGTWQAIRKRHSPRDSMTSTNLETSVHVYAVAQAYGLPDLAELAKVNISQSAEALPAFDVIVLASEACRILPDDDPWFLAFIKMRIEHLFKEPSTLNEPVLLEYFRGDTPYSKILAKSLVRICCENSFSIKAAQSCALSPPELPTVPETDVPIPTDSLQTPDSVSEPRPTFTVEIETEATTEVEDPGFRAYVEKDLAQKQEAVAAPEAVTESKPEVPEVEEDLFAGRTKSEKKKKKAKMAAAAAAAAVANIHGS